MWMIMASVNGNSSKPCYLLLKENANANGKRWSFLLKRKYKQRAWQDNYDWQEDEKLYFSFLSLMFINPFLRIFRFSLDRNIVFQNTISNCHWHISYLSCHKKIWWNIQLAGNLRRTLIPVCRFQLLITVKNRRKYFKDCVQLFLGPISTFLHQFSLPPISRPSRNIS